MPEFRKLAQDVYVFVQPPLVWYSSAGVIVGERDVIVVDSLTNAAMTQNLLMEIRRVTDKPIRFLINTHSHADHVYTNHLFTEATVIGTHQGRARTRANQMDQARHDAMFAQLFPEVDFKGGRYTLQDISFGGSLTLYQGAREVRLLELGAGHSESDVVVYLPAENILFCGDLFMNNMPPLPGEGHVTQTIANYRAIEALEASIYVAGHGEPGTLAEVRAQRTMLEQQFQHAKTCFERGMSFDMAIKTLADNALPLTSQKLILLGSYCELSGHLPQSVDPVCQNHLALLQGVATEARRLLGKP